MASVLPEYDITVLVDIYLDGGTQRRATRDFYDGSGNYYKGNLLEAPRLSQELSDLYYGVEQSTSITLRLSNADDGVDDTWDDIVTTNADEPRNRWVTMQRHDPLDGFTFEFRGRITGYSLGPVVEITVEMRDDDILETLLPKEVVTTGSNYGITAVSVANETFDISGDYTSIFLPGTVFRVEVSTANDDVWVVSSSAAIAGPGTRITVTEDIGDATVDGIIFVGFTITALDLGEPVNICFGHCRNVPLPNIQNKITAKATTTGTTANKLVHVGAGFREEDDLNNYVYNATDKTWAKITAVDDTDTLSLDADIMVSGDDYFIHAHDYLVGYGVTEDLWEDATKDLGVKRDGAIAKTTDYDFYDGSQATQFHGYSFVRFAKEQMSHTGAMHAITADVKGLEMGGATAERNFADVIEQLLSDAIWGLGDSVDATSFTNAATALDTIGDMYCDGSITKQRMARDVLDDLLFPARARIERAADGEWEIAIDTGGSSVLSVGDNDGYYNNAEVTRTYATPARDALKEATLHYALDPSNEDKPFNEMRVGVHANFGTSRTYELPFVLESDTAERVLSYLKNRSLYSDARATLTVGMEGRDLSRGDVITVSAPARNLVAKEYMIDGITKGISDFELDCREYSGSIYNNVTIVSSAALVGANFVVQGPKTFLGKIVLGDGTGQPGDITMSVADGEGDIYLAGKSDAATFDFDLWKVNGGFILGIDDKVAGNPAKFFIGDSSGDNLLWNGTTLAITGDMTIDAGAVGGWTITAGYIYSLAGGTPTAAPDDGVVLASGNPALIVYEDTAKRVEVGYLSAGVYGIKGYDSGGVNVMFELSDTQQLIAGWTISQTTLANGTDIILDASNKAISINDATYGNAGIQLQFNAGTPRIYAGDGANEFFQYDGTNVSWKGANSELNASGNIICTGGQIGGFYIGANDLWGGNAAIGNAATTIVMGNLDGTSKIALGASADAIDVGGAAAGFIADGTGKLYVGDGANDYFKYDGANVTISCSIAGDALTIKSGADIKIEAGGDIILIGNDADPGTIIFDGQGGGSIDVIFGAKADGTSVGIYPSTTKTGDFKIGFNFDGVTVTPFNNVIFHAFTDAEMRVEDPDAAGDLVRFKVTHTANTNSAQIYCDHSGGGGQTSIYLYTTNTPDSYIDFNTTNARQLRIDKNGDATFTHNIFMTDTHYIGIDSAERLEFYAAGYATFEGCNVSIGVGGVPDDIVHIHKGSAGAIAGILPLVVENDTTSGINILNPNESYGGVYFGGPADADAGRVLYGGSNVAGATDRNVMWFYTAGNNRRIGIGSSGDVLIGGNVIADSKLHVWNGTAGAVTAVANTILTLENNGYVYLSMLTNTNGVAGLIIGENTSNNVAYFFYDTGNQYWIWDVEGTIELRLSNVSLYPNTTNGLDLGAAARRFGTGYFTTVNHCGLVEPTCAYMGNYSAEQLYRMFRQIEPVTDGALHHTNGSIGYYPHTDFESLPDEFICRAEEEFEIELFHNVKGEMVEKKKLYKVGEKSAIDRTVQGDALIALVVKMYEQNQELKAEVEILKGTEVETPPSPPES